MQLLIDVEKDEQGNVIARHWIHTERAPWNRINDPKHQGNTLDMIDFLALCAQDVELREKAGYHVISQIGEKEHQISRWDHFKNACAHPAAEPEMKAIVFK